MKKKPQLIGFLNSFSHGKSGGDMVFIEILKRITGFEINIITSFLGKELCKNAGLKGNFFITSDEKEFKRVIFTYLRRIIKALVLKFTLKKNDIILSSSDFLPDVLPAFLLKLNYKDAVWVSHIFHLIPAARIISYLNQKISFILIKLKANCIIVDNSLLKEDLIRLGFDPSTIFVNYPGINQSILKKIKRDKDHDYQAVFMAQLRPSKGLFDLIQIWKRVCDKYPKFKLGVIGKGNNDLVERFLYECKKNGIMKNIDLLGYLPDIEAFSVIKSSRIFVFPSREEGFGMAALEAQALGLPVLAWNLPVYNEIFPKGMLKIEIGDFAQFANKIISCLTNKSLYKNLQIESIYNANRFNWNKTANIEKRIVQRHYS